MSVSFVLGNLLGRALLSFALVWIVCLLISRLDWRRAFARSQRWYSVLSVALLTMLGMGSAIVTTGGVR
jgi:apolipoprotein N-acyltransferase